MCPGNVISVKAPLYLIVLVSLRTPQLQIEIQEVLRHVKLGTIVLIVVHLVVYVDFNINRIASVRSETLHFYGL